MMKNYDEHFKLIKQGMNNLGKAAPEVMSGFAQLHKAAISEGVLSAKVKELLALAIAVTVRCDGCITYHVHEAIDAGASREEIAEAIGVAVLMGGGPSVVYGSEALEVLAQFEKKNNKQ